MLRSLIWSGFFLLTPLLSLYTQYTETQSGREILSEKAAAERGRYDSLFRVDLQLVDGRAHTSSYPSGIGHPFFLTGEPVPGTIRMDGKNFKNSFIRYDLLNDMLQIYHFTVSGPQIIDLNKKKIEAFRIAGYQFIHFSSAKIQGVSAKEGFYEEKYKGSSFSYLVRREKIFTENITGSRGGYEEYTYRYLSTPGAMFRITSRSSLLKAFDENREQIKEYIRKLGLTVKLATDEEIIDLIKYNELITGTR